MRGGTMMKANKNITEQISQISENNLTNLVQRNNEIIESEYVRKQMVCLQDKNDSCSITNGEEYNNNILFSVDYS